MSQEQPKYWGTWEGAIVKVLVEHENEFINFKILEAKTGLTPNGLKKALPKLYNEKIIQKDGERYILIDDNIKIEWKKFLETNPAKEAEPKTLVEKSVQAKKQVIEKEPLKIENELIQWLTKWVTDKPINITLDSKHFFLEGMRLEEFTRDVIGKSKDEILVTNPYLDSCYLTTALQEARERRVNVRIVSRRPTKDKNDISKLECHATMRKKGVTIHYINTIHSKIIVIDRKITIISSMNLYSGSAGGGVLEAGVVSFENKVVESATKYITELLEKTESPDISSYSNSRYYRR
jgi:phosphatidylserine/phosphatidylglycerophosphate/cardiolipin synthase-like enzyme